MNRTQKEQLVEDLKTEWAKVNTAFLVEFRGLSVPDATRLRDEVRAAQAEYRVVKNTIAGRAMAATPLEALAADLRGPTAVAYTGADAVALAKVLVNFAKDVPALTMKSGILEGQPIGAADMASVAAMPGRSELIAQLVGLLGSPVRRLAVALNAPISQFVSVLDQIREKREGAG